MTWPTLETRNRLGQWIRENRVPLLFLLLLLAMLPLRDLWSPDEPDFAQCVREMRERGTWLLPYLNGEPYNEKPILFYWLMKGFAILGERLTGGLGFSHGVAAWALRLPSILAAASFVFAFRAWAVRFWKEGAAEFSTLVLVATPLRVWQAQFIQIDMLFAALLAWSWLAWLGGYLILRGEVEARHPSEPGRWFLAAYLCLALAFLAKGPLALVLSAALLLAFLAWQRDLKALARMRLGWGLLLMVGLVSPWYIVAGIRGGPAYAYQMIVHQNLERALKAWDHIQPWWRYAQYMAGDFFPWTLLLPSLALFLRRDGAQRRPTDRFLILAVAVPFLLLSCSQSKQGKYILMAYPFLALLMGGMARELALETEPSRRGRRLGALLAGALGLPALALLAVAFLHAGGHRLQAQVAPYLGPVRLGALALLAGALLLALEARRGTARHLVRNTAMTILALFLVAGTWGFHRLDPHKGYRNWTTTVRPLIQGRRVHFWQTIRSGAMVYTDQLMPELRTAQELDALAPGELLVATGRDWPSGQGGLTDSTRGRFETLLRMPVGGGEFMLLRKMETQP